MRWSRSSPRLVRCVSSNRLCCSSTSPIEMSLQPEAKTEFLFFFACCMVVFASTSGRCFCACGLRMCVSLLRMTVRRVGVWNGMLGGASVGGATGVVYDALQRIFTGQNGVATAGRPESVFAPSSLAATGSTAQPE